MRRACKGGQGGQAAVETAIILPLMTFLVLGIIQLTMVQQAALMTEYAAYQACRAGIVWNADHETANNRHATGNGKMEDAAIVALAPTASGGHLFPMAPAVHEGAQGLVDLAADVAVMQGINKATRLAGMPVIRVDVVNPDSTQFGKFKTRSGLPNPQELVFDDVGYKSTDGIQDGFAKEEDYRQALQLTIRVRYLYELKIPFADWIIQTCFFAFNAPNFLQNQVGGALGEENLTRGSSVQSGDSNVTAGVLAAADRQKTDGPRGKPILTSGEFRKLYLARATLKVYLIPLTATYTMRMQSNFYEKNLDN